MGVRYLWDTNIAIYFLQRQFPASAEQFIDNILETSPPIISAISEIELLCWPHTTEEDKTLLVSFPADTTIKEMDKRIRMRTAEVRKLYKVKLPDAVIAATALEHDLTLITRNEGDFKRVGGLKVLNPWAL